MFDTNGDGMIDIQEFKSVLPTAHRSTILETTQIGQGGQHLLSESTLGEDSIDLFI
jgi:Ca2+-binding EF-hand superfamily protein